MSEKIVMGVDGGNTSCRVVLANTNAIVLGYGKSGAASVDGVDANTAARHIREAFNAAWLDTGQSPQPIAASFWGMAGVASEKDRTTMREIILKSFSPAPAQIEIDHDIRIALEGGLGGEPGIALIVGTGCSCYGRTKEGKSLRVGGWGHILDDGGSSYFLGLEAIKAVVRTADGRNRSTSLTKIVMQHLGIEDVQEIMYQIYVKGIEKTSIAALAPFVLAEAQNGDPTAKKIVKTGFDELAALVNVASTRLGKEGKKLTITGGLAHSGVFFKNGLYKAIQAQVPDIQILEPLLPPVLGAVLLALQMIEPSVTSEFIPVLQQNAQKLVQKMEKNSGETIWRKASQHLMPSSKPQSTGTNEYEIYPSHSIGSGKITRSYEKLIESLKDSRIIVADGFPGVYWENFRSQFSDALLRAGIHANFINVQQAMLPTNKIENLVRPFLGGDDPLFGKRFPGELNQFFDVEILKSFKYDPSYQVNVLYGCGAELVGWKGVHLYLDVPKNEIQYRARASSIRNLGLEISLPPAIAYKRSYFIDWVVANKHKAKLLPHLDWVVDEQNPDTPMVISGTDLRKGLAQLSRTYFRARPWFEPGPWGGQWIRRNIPALAQDVPDYAWSFELIAPENGLIFESDGNLLEVSFDTLMFQEYQAVLGESAEKFKHEFPIRYDFLDTVEGGNLSVQVHPRPEYIRENFGEVFTQDECYYILDCLPGARVNLGFQAGISADGFKQVLQESAKNCTPVEMEKFVQAFPAKKHELFLIPNGTIHGSGAGSMVLEISATPYIFTFKMYDWLRLGLDGRPRTLNIERAFANLFFDRQGERVKNEFISKSEVILEITEKEKYQRVVHMPTHAAHFYDVHRLEFNACIEVKTENSCHVLSLVEGRSVVLETAEGARSEFHYAETFIVPAAANSYKLISPIGEETKVVKTFIKPINQWIPGVLAE